MRQFLLPILIIVSSLCHPQPEERDQNIEQLSLFEALELFFERKGGDISNLDILPLQDELSLKNEPLAEISSGVKSLLQDLSQEQKGQAEQNKIY